MSFMGRYDTHAVIAAEDLSSPGHLYKAIAIDDRKLANRGDEAAGILLHGGESGDHVTLGLNGVMKFAAGAAVDAGAKLTVVGSGWFKAAGDGDVVVGRALEAVSSGEIGSGHFDFAGGGSFDSLVPFTTANDMSAAGHLGKFVDFSTGDFADGTQPDGVLRIGAASGGMAYADVGLVTGLPNSAAIGAGRMCKAASGYATAANSGDWAFVKALEASAVNDPTAIVFFTTGPVYLTNCLGAGI